MNKPAIFDIMVDGRRKKKFGFRRVRAEPESFHVSYWASLEIEMSLLKKRLSEGHFMEESVGF